jgi:hypothetical protein
MPTRFSYRFARVWSVAIVTVATLMTGTFSAMALTSIGTDISTDGALSVSSNATFDTSTLYVNATTNHVGVLTTSPSSELDVRDGSASPSTNIFQVANLNDSSRYFTVSSTSVQVIGGSRFLVGATNTLVVNSSGNFESVNGVVTRFPEGQGSNGQFLTNDGAGNLTWTTPAASTSNLNQAYLSSTSTGVTAEISITPSLGAVTIADTFSGTGNVFEVQNRTSSAGSYSQRYFTVSATAVGIFSNAPNATLTVQNLVDTGGTVLDLRTGGSSIFSVDYQGNIVGDRSLTISRTVQLAAAADEYWPNPGLAIIPSALFEQDLIQTKTGSTYRFVVKNTGFVGIMTSTPGAEIDVRDTSASPTSNILQVANLNDSSRYFTVSSTSTSIQTDVNLENGTGSVATNAVTINASSGVITDTTDINLSSTRATITLTNSRISATSVVIVSACSTPDSGAMLVAAATPGAGSATLTVRNVGLSNQTSEWKICFIVTN